MRRLSSPESWWAFEDMYKSFWSKLEYKGVNLWYIVRRDLFDYCWDVRRYPKIRQNAVFMNMSNFVSHLAVYIVCRLLVRKRRYEGHNRRSLLGVRGRDFGFVRDARSGERIYGLNMYNSLLHEMIDRKMEPVILFEFPNPNEIVKGLKAVIRNRHTIIVSDAYWSLRIWVKAFIYSRYFVRYWWCWRDRIDVSMAVKKEFDVVFTYWILTVIEDVEMSIKILNELKPDITFSWSSGGFRLALCLVAKKGGYKTAMYDYGVAADWRELEREEIDDMPDKIFIALKSKIGLYLSRRFPEKRLSLVGNLTYDIVNIADKIYSRAEFAAKYNLDLQKQFVVIVLGHEIHDEALLKAVLPLREMVQLIIRPHPQDDVSKLIKYDLPIATGELFEIIYCSDMFVGLFSSVLEESVMFGKKAVSVYVDSEFGYGKTYSGVIPVVSITEVSNFIKQQMCGLERHEMDSLCDGKVAKRIVDGMEEMIQ
jgi:hypothetical protein